MAAWPLTMLNIFTERWPQRLGRAASASYSCPATDAHQHSQAAGGTQITQIWMIGFLPP